MTSAKLKPEPPQPSEATDIEVKIKEYLIL